MQKHQKRKKSTPNIPTLCTSKKKKYFCRHKIHIYRKKTRKNILIKTKKKTFTYIGHKKYYYHHYSYELIPKNPPLRTKKYFPRIIMNKHVYFVHKNTKKVNQKKNYPLQKHHSSKKLLTTKNGSVKN